MEVEELDLKDRISALREEVEKTGHSADKTALVELLKLLSDSPESRAEVRELCFQALSRDKENGLVRLSLARSFYLDGHIEFCLRELLELKKHRAPRID